MTPSARALGALAVLSLLAPSAALARDGAPQRAYADPSTWGPYGVGVIDIDVRARHHGREPLHALVWYPADVSGGDAPYVYLDDETMGALSGTAVEGAPLISSPEAYPVIAFSHGNGGVRYQSIFLTEHLASHGYVVISTDHPGNTMFDYEVTSLVTGGITRPLDISALIDEMERQNRAPDSMFRGQLDLTRVGMTGHSFGGTTSLQVSGARLNFNLLEAQCDGGDAAACEAVRLAHKWGGFDDGFLDLSDDRVKASVPLAPLGWEPFREEGLATIFIPMQLQGGGLDDTCPYDTEVYPAYQYASGPRGILNIYDAGHYAWSDICLLDATFEDCSDPFIDMDLGHELINTWATSHFKVFLDGDPRYEPFLSADYAAGFADVLGWESTFRF